MNDALAQLREKISEVDSRLVELIAARQALACQVGETKAKHGLPVKNQAVEAAVLAVNCERAKRLGVDETLVTQIMGTLIEASCDIQSSQGARTGAP